MNDRRGKRCSPSAEGVGYTTLKIVEFHSVWTNVTENGPAPESFALSQSVQAVARGDSARIIVAMSRKSAIGVDDGGRDTIQ